VLWPLLRVCPGPEVQAALSARRPRVVPGQRVDPTCQLLFPGPWGSFQSWHSDFLALAAENHGSASRKQRGVRSRDFNAPCALNAQSFLAFMHSRHLLGLALTRLLRPRLQCRMHRAAGPAAPVGMGLGRGPQSTVKRYVPSSTGRARKGSTGSAQPGGTGGTPRNRKARRGPKSPKAGTTLRGGRLLQVEHEERVEEHQGGGGMVHTGEQQSAGQTHQQRQHWGSLWQSLWGSDGGTEQQREEHNKQHSTKQRWHRPEGNATITQMNTQHTAPPGSPQNCLWHHVQWPERRAAAKCTRRE